MVQFRTTLPETSHPEGEAQPRLVELYLHYRGSRTLVLNVSSEVRVRPEVATTVVVAAVSAKAWSIAKEYRFIDCIGIFKDLE